MLVHTKTPDNLSEPNNICLSNKTMQVSATPDPIERRKKAHLKLQISSKGREHFYSDIGNRVFKKYKPTPTANK